MAACNAILESPVTRDSSCKFGKPLFSFSIFQSLVLEWISIDHLEDDAILDPIIALHITDRQPKDLNNAFTINELEQSLKKLKSKATGLGQIHNDMLSNLSPTNKLKILHLFNVLDVNDFVQNLWKKATVIPYLKQGKLTDTASSYRPINLTSCLSKLFDRIITARLSWFVESKNIKGQEQAGFRKNRYNTDHLIKIDHLIKKKTLKKKIYCSSLP